MRAVLWLALGVALGMLRGVRGSVTRRRQPAPPPANWRDMFRGTEPGDRL